MGAVWETRMVDWGRGGNNGELSCSIKWGVPDTVGDLWWVGDSTWKWEKIEHYRPHKQISSFSSEKKLRIQGTRLGLMYHIHNYTPLPFYTSCKNASLLYCPTTLVPLRPNTHVLMKCSLLWQLHLVRSFSCQSFDYIDALTSPQGKWS